jgi:glucokinase
MTTPGAEPSTQSKGRPASASPGQRVLLADIGATNCRLLLEGGGPPEGDRLASYATADYASPAEAIAAFLAEAGGPAPSVAALAVAGPVGRGPVRLTNTAWTIDRDGLERALELRRLIVVNDLAAQARAVIDLGPDALVPIGKPSGEPRPGSIAVVGPGTGLGVARADRGPPPAATATEGGHVGFAPSDDVELALLASWRGALGRVVNEQVVSGPGLARLHQGLGALKGVAVAPLEGAEITARALGDGDALCLEAIRRFAAILGTVCADIVLAQGATSLVLVGGIATALAPILREGEFRARFERGGPGGDHLSAVPSHLATTANLGLMGARACLQDALAGG